MVPKTSVTPLCLVGNLKQAGLSEVYLRRVVRVSFIAFFRLSLCIKVTRLLPFIRGPFVRGSYACLELLVLRGLYDIILFSRRRFQLYQTTPAYDQKNVRIVVADAAIDGLLSEPWNVPVLPWNVLFILRLRYFAGIGSSPALWFDSSSFLPSGYRVHFHARGSDFFPAQGVPIKVGLEKNIFSNSLFFHRLVSSLCPGILAKILFAADFYSVIIFLLFTFLPFIFGFLLYYSYRHAWWYVGVVRIRQMEHGVSRLLSFSGSRHWECYII